LLLVFSLTTTTAFAANFTVTNELWARPGSLRQAVLDANANPGEVDTITFDPSVNMINQGDLLVSHPIYITQSALIKDAGADI